MKKIILVTGGERSGKSSYAEKLALSLSDHPIYMATARIWDEEFRERVKHHQASRGTQWSNIEEEKQLSKHNVEGRVVMIDCVTLWATNYFFDLRPEEQNKEFSIAENTNIGAEQQKAEEAALHVKSTLQALKDEFDQFTQSDATYIFVSNEIGLGGIPADPIQRRFTDMLGWMNQYIAQQANEVILMVSGIPVKIKEQ